MRPLEIERAIYYSDAFGGPGEMVTFTRLDDETDERIFAVIPYTDPTVVGVMLVTGEGSKTVVHRRQEVAIWELVDVAFSWLAGV